MLLHVHVLCPPQSAILHVTSQDRQSQLVFIANKHEHTHSVVAITTDAAAVTGAADVGARNIHF
jgi:hypothetical protein